MLALARLYLTMDDLDSCQQQCVQLLKMDSENDAATVVSTSIDVPYASDFSVFFLRSQSIHYSNYFHTRDCSQSVFGHTKQKLYIKSGPVQYPPFSLFILFVFILFYVRTVVLFSYSMYWC